MLSNVAHHARPLAPRPLVCLGGISGAPNEGSERILLGKHIQPAQSNGALSSSNVLSFCRPPGDQGIYRGQIAIDRAAVGARKRSLNRLFSDLPYDPNLRNYGNIQVAFRAGAYPTGMSATSFSDWISTTETLLVCSFAT